MGISGWRYVGWDLWVEVCGWGSLGRGMRVGISGWRHVGGDLCVEVCG